MRSSGTRTPVIVGSGKGDVTDVRYSVSVPGDAVGAAGCCYCLGVSLCSARQFSAPVPVCFLFLLML